MYEEISCSTETFETLFLVIARSSALTTKAKVSDTIDDSIVEKQHWLRGCAWETISCIGSRSGSVSRHKSVLIVLPRLELSLLFMIDYIGL